MSDPLDRDRFPKRPDHPDFWQLSEVCLQHDGQLEDNKFADAVNAVIDLDTLSYFAIERAKRLGSQQDQQRAAATFMDAFLIGVRYASHYPRAHD